MLYRPYPDKGGALLDGPHFRARFPGLRTCDTDFHKALLGCRLAVIDHPETTLMIALAANVPFVAFWNPRQRTPARQAARHFDHLRSVGLLFDDPSAAAAQVAAVWDDVDVWWSDASRQDARRAFRDAYGRVSPTWWWDWCRALWTI